MRIIYGVASVGLALALALSFSIIRARAQQPKIIGNWIVTVEADRFSDAAPKVIALTTDKRGGLFAVRCLSNELSFALLGSYKEGDLFMIKYRADKNPIVDTIARAISDKVLQIETTPEMFRQLIAAKEYAFRVTGTASSDFVFQAGSGAKTALAEVAKACSL